MHRIPATPGGWTSDNEGVVFVQQNSAPIIFLSAADTDIQNSVHAINHLPPDFPAIRAVNFLQLQQTTNESFHSFFKSQSSIMAIFNWRVHRKLGKFFKIHL